MLITGALLGFPGDMHIGSLILTAWAGAVTGDAIGYAIGRFGGRALVVRYGRYVLLDKRRLEYVESFFQRHGGAVVVVARFFEVLRRSTVLLRGLPKCPGGVS